MSGVVNEKSKGIMRSGWSAMVGDYAIAGCWTQDGKALVVGDSGGGVTAFRGTSGETIWAREEAHKGGLFAMSVHPSGAEIATAGQDGRVLLWGADDGQLRRAIDVGSSWVEHVAWSPDGQQLAVSYARKVRVYSPDGTERWSTADHPSTVSAISWSRTGELATACYGRVAFFDGSTGSPRQKLEWRGSLVSMVLSPDGGIVACGSQDKSVHFWRRATGNDSMMSGYPGKPSALTFDSTGTLLATSGGEAVLVWSFQGNGPEGTRPGILERHNDRITTLAFPRRGMRLASGGRDGAVVVWSLQPSGEGSLVGAAVMEDGVSEVLWRPDGNALAALNAQGTVTTWRVRG